MIYSHCYTYLFVIQILGTMADTTRDNSLTDKLLCDLHTELSLLRESTITIQKDLELIRSDVSDLKCQTSDLRDEVAHLSVPQTELISLDTDVEEPEVI